MNTVRGGAKYVIRVNTKISWARFIQVLVSNAEQVGTLPPPALDLVVSVHRASTKINQGRVLVMTAR